MRDSFEMIGPESGDNNRLRLPPLHLLTKFGFYMLATTGSYLIFVIFFTLTHFFPENFTL